MSFSLPLFNNESITRAMLLLVKAQSRMARAEKSFERNYCWETNFALESERAVVRGLSAHLSAKMRRALNA